VRTLNCPVGYAYPAAIAAFAVAVALMNRGVGIRD